MIRTPLRPLARILSARAKGENPDAIERENIRLRGEAIRERARATAEGRLFFMGLLFVTAFLTVGLRMGTMAATQPQEPQGAGTIEELIAKHRHDRPGEDHAHADGQPEHEQGNGVPSIDA